MRKKYVEERKMLIYVSFYAKTLADLKICTLRSKAYKPVYFNACNDRLKGKKVLILKLVLRSATSKFINYFERRVYITENAFIYFV